MQIICREVRTMWTYEHTVETTARPETVWRLWADVPHWHEWNADLATATLRGGFADGGEITMTTGAASGGETVELTLADVTAGERFVDEAAFAGVVVRTTHRLEPVCGGRTRIRYAVEITGAAADEVGPRAGPGITADWPDTMAALAAHAERAEQAERDRV